MTIAGHAYMSVLKRLARLHGVQASYADAFGETRRASAESLARVITALGSPCATEAQALASERERLRDAAMRRIEPVSVAWTGPGGGRVPFAVESPARGRVSWVLRLETGEEVEGSAEAGSLKSRLRRGVRGEGVTWTDIPLPGDMPTGYHRLSIHHAGRRLETTVIVSPRKSFRHERGVYEREWGVFCPIYSLRSDRNAGVGDLTDLRDLARWSEGLGGRVVATLPLLACHLGERKGPVDPSPYAPVSRLFWNEAFIDPARTAEFDGCEAARRIVESAEYRREASRLRGAGLVDYARVGALKRRVIEALSRRFFDADGDRTGPFRAFVAENPMAREYALFRATTERRGEAWTDWPSELRGRRLSERDAEPAAVRHHLYAQYAAWMELLALGAEMKAAGGLMYLDLPVGVSPFGFDTWRHRGLFAEGSTGAPPDPYFTGGQNWGFPPMHPETCRDDAYAYFRACLRAHMRHADYLRLDHVMAFHRLFWIPEGMRPADGVYVRYRDEELYAVLCLESHRGRCRLVGENLGTVPPEVNRAIRRHDLCGLYVGQYEMQPKPPALRDVPANCVASVNTHDMPPFATAWSGGDVDDRIALKMLDRRRKSAELAARKKTKAALVAFLRKARLLKPGKADARSARDALLMFLAQSPAEFVLVNLEDLWLETKWQNVPGTMREHPNWRRKLRLTLPEITKNKPLARLLSRINKDRQTSPPRKRRRP